jgi:hypothetical protein
VFATTRHFELLAVDMRLVIQYEALQGGGGVTVCLCVLSHNTLLTSKNMAAPLPLLASAQLLGVGGEKKYQHRDKDAT